MGSQQICKHYPPNNDVYFCLYQPYDTNFDALIGAKIGRVTCTLTISGALLNREAHIQVHAHMCVLAVILGVYLRGGGVSAIHNHENLHTQIYIGQACTLQQYTI